MTANQVDANFRRLDHIHNDLAAGITSIVNNDNANTSTISNVLAAGGSIGPAQSLLDAADAAIANGNFKAAYSYLRRAYKAAGK